jgi:hypothetical protein
MRIHKIFFTVAVFLGIAIVYTIQLHHVSAVTTSTTPIIPATFTFQNNLKQGDTIIDVQYLQAVLDSRVETQVATTGPGSITQLTSYFGPLTENAVMRFQEFYRADILTPAGLANPTGYVGPSTRNKLNSLLALARGTTGIYTAQSGTLQLANTGTRGTPADKEASGIIIAGPETSLIQAKDLYTATTSYGDRIYGLPPSALNSSVNTTKPTGSLSIIGLSTYQTKPNVVMSIFGNNFTSKNNVFLGPVHIGSYSSNITGNQITFTVPNYLPRGFYQVGVSNIYGTTTTSKDQILILETPTNTAAQIVRPVIDTITPAYSSNINDAIVITGSNFTIDNTIVTNLGNITETISLDGRTIIFYVGALPYFLQAQKDYRGASINLMIKVQNENGISTDIVNHVIKFPNSDTPTVNQFAQRAVINATTLQDFNDASSTESSATGTGGGSTSNGSKKSSSQTSTTDSLKPIADPATDLLRQLDPNFKQITSPIFSNVSPAGQVLGGSGGGSTGSGMSGGFGSGIGGGNAGGGTGSGIIDYFGGTITQTKVCTCPTDLRTLITVDDYASGQSIDMFYSPYTSKLNANFNVWSTGVYVIGGLKQGGGDCEMYQGEECSAEGSANYTIDNIRGVGTSMY